MLNKMLSKPFLSFKINLTEEKDVKKYFTHSGDI